MRKERRKTIRSKQEIIVSCIVFPILFLWSLTLLYPFLWAFLNSLKEPGGVSAGLLLSARQVAVFQLGDGG